MLINLCSCIFILKTILLCIFWALQEQSQAPLSFIFITLHSVPKPSFYHWLKFEEKNKHAVKLWTNCHFEEADTIGNTKNERLHYLLKRINLILRPEFNYHYCRGRKEEDKRLVYGFGLATSFGTIKCSAFITLNDRITRQMITCNNNKEVCYLGIGHRSYSHQVYH